jgi:hypothetical protein
MKSPYLKFAAQVIATIISAVALAFGDGQVSASEWINVVILGLGSVAVLGAGNLPSGVWSHTKTIVSAATAGAVFLQSAITGGIDGAEWLQLVLAVLGALGVLAVKGPVVVPAGRHEAV